MLDLWIGVATSCPSGMLVAWDEQDIALEAGWEKEPQEFVEALLGCRFLEKMDCGTYKLHDWEKHQGYAIHAEQRSEKARKAAEKRWNSKNGEKPINATSMQQACGEDANSNAPSPNPNPVPNPNPAPLAEKTSGEKTPPEPPKPSVFNPLSLRPDWITEKDWSDLISHRNKHKQKPANTARAYEALIRQLQIASSNGFSITECIDTITRRNWAGFEAAWMHNTRAPPQQNNQQMTTKERHARELLGL